jgi:hypothetical protein
MNSRHISNLNFLRSTTVIALVLALAASLVASSPGFAEGKPNGSGILVMAHGGSEEWNQRIKEMVEPLRTKYPVEIAFGMARASTMAEGVKQLEAKGVEQIAVVRMFISGESFLDQTKYILGLRDEKPHGHFMEPPTVIDTEAKILLSRDGVGDSELVDGILADRVQTLSQDPSKERILFIAHGPADDEENERWLTSMRARGQRIGKELNFSAVHFETLREDWPEKRKSAEARIRQVVEQGNKEGERVIVVPFRMAGIGPYRDVLEGLDYVADEKGLCPHPNITKWIEQTAIELWRQ